MLQPLECAFIFGCLVEFESKLVLNGYGNCLKILELQRVAMWAFCEVLWWLRCSLLAWICRFVVYLVFSKLHESSVGPIIPSYMWQFFFSFQWQHHHILFCKGRRQLYICTSLPWNLYAKENPLWERSGPNILTAIRNRHWPRLFWIGSAIKALARGRYISACYLCWSILTFSLYIYESRAWQAFANHVYSCTNNWSCLGEK